MKKSGGAAPASGGAAPVAAAPHRLAAASARADGGVTGSLPCPEPPIDMDHQVV